MADWKICVFLICALCALDGAVDPVSAEDNVANLQQEKLAQTLHQDDASGEGTDGDDETNDNVVKDDTVTGIDKKKTSTKSPHTWSTHHRGNYTHEPSNFTTTHRPTKHTKSATRPTMSTTTSKSSSGNDAFSVEWFFVGIASCLGLIIIIVAGFILCKKCCSRPGGSYSSL